MARRPQGGVPLSSRSLSEASTSSSAAPPATLHALRWTGYMLDIQPPAPGRRCSPAVLPRSRTATRPVRQVSARPGTAIIMLHPGRRQPWLASAAHVKCKLHMLSQAQGSRPGPPTDGNRRAFPHGKASPGRGASLLPAWCTAGAPRARSGRVPAPAPRQDGRPTASPGTRLAPPT